MCVSCTTKPRPLGLNEKRVRAVSVGGLSAQVFEENSQRAGPLSLLNQGKEETRAIADPPQGAGRHSWETVGTAPPCLKETEA